MTQFQKKEKINLEVIVHEKTLEKTMAMQIFLTPICGVDPLHTLYSVFLKHCMQNCYPSAGDIFHSNFSPLLRFKSLSTECTNW